MKTGLSRSLGLTAAGLGLALLLLGLPDAAWAQAAQGLPGLPDLPGFSVTPAPGGGQTVSLNIQLLVLLTSLTFLPALVLMMSSFTRIIIVLSLLRMALGTQSTPPNQVLIGLALFLSFFIMGPTIDRVYTEAYQPFAAGGMGLDAFAEAASAPLREFMMAQTREADLAMFAQIAQLPPLADESAVPMRILIPAFITSELKTAFQIGFAVFIPFLIIDMIVASVLMAMGMMMVSPAIVALPFKLMLFVLVDGWSLLMGSLAASFAR